MEYLHRGIEDELLRRLNVEALVVLEGARATGKTRLVQHAVDSRWLSDVRTFLDEAELAAARAAPADYVEGLLHGTAIDEAQLCEAILLPLKKRVEREPPGAFLLTGSTRLRRDALGGSDPLAGRTGSSLQLGPLTVGERAGDPLQLVTQLFDADPADIPVGEAIARSELTKLVSQPGLPDFFRLNPVDAHDRSLAYVRQVTSLPAFSSLDLQKVNQLATFLAGRTSTLVNISSYAAATETARNTVENYLARLEEALLVLRLRGWRRSKDKSETDKPKIHFFDAGIAASLSRMQPDTNADHLGRLAETVVVTELTRQCGWLAGGPTAYHWRRSQREEVDLLLEATDGRVVCIEIKSSERIDKRDFRGIDAFRKAYPSAYHRGFVFYTGRRVLPFGENRWAIPLAALRSAAVETQSSSIPAIAGKINARRREYRETAAAGASPVQFLNEAERQLRELATHLPDYETTVDRTPTSVGLTAWNPDSGNGRQLISVTAHDHNETIVMRVPGGQRAPQQQLPISGDEPGPAISEALRSLADDVAMLLAQFDQERDGG